MDQMIRQRLWSIMPLSDWPFGSRHSLNFVFLFYFLSLSLMCSWMVTGQFPNNKKKTFRIHHQWEKGRKRVDIWVGLRATIKFECHRDWKNVSSVLQRINNNNKKITWKLYTLQNLYKERLLGVRVCVCRGLAWAKMELYKSYKIDGPTTAFYQLGRFWRKVKNVGWWTRALVSFVRFFFFFT